MKIKDIFILIGFILVASASGFAIYLGMNKQGSYTTIQNIELENVLSHEVEMPDTLDFAGEIVPLQMYYVRERLERELLSNTYFHSNTILLLKRSTRWFPVMDSILNQYGIPEDFKYLAMIESNLTNAVSPSNAVGFWQFLPGTAKDFNLQVDKEVDMRYNVELETVAACKYFLKSYDKFHSWTLVAAAFNAGNARITKFMQDQKVNSYYDMLLSQETERYVFRILALKLISQAPDRYGFFIDPNRTYKPLTYQTVSVDTTVNSWADFAKSYGISYKLLKSFNPWLRSGGLKVKKGEHYEVKIPTAPFNLTHEALMQQGTN